MIQEDVKLDEAILDDDCGCQIRHRDPSNCTIEVTHRLVSCRKQVLMCDHGTRYKRAEIAGDGWCRGCGAPVGSCWKIHPV